MLPFVSTLVRRKLEFVGKTAIITALYLLLAKIGLLFALKENNVTIFWPAGGFALAILLLEGITFLPAIFIGAFLTGLLSNDSTPVSLAIAFGNTLESGLAFMLLKRFPRFSRRLENAESFLILVGCAMLSAFASALVGPFSLLASKVIGEEELLVMMQYWWMADVLGILFLTPLILTIEGTVPLSWKREKITEASCLLLITFLIGQATFYGKWWLPIPFQAELIPGWIIPTAIWAALRFDPKFANLVNLLIFVMALWSAHLGLGYFGKHMLADNIYNCWTFGMALSLGGMVIALKEAERKRLLKNLQLTQFAMDHAAIEVYWIKADGGIDYVNEQACRELGYSSEELLQLSIPDLDPDFEKSRWQYHWQKLCNEKIVKLETKHRRKDGTIRSIEVSANYLKFDDIEYNIAFTQNISDRKQWEAHLQSSQQRFRDLFNHSPDPCWLIDNNRFVACNFAAANTLGYGSIDELLAIHPAQLATYLKISGGSVPSKMNQMMAIAREKGVHRFEWTHQHRDGHAIPVEVTLSRIQIEEKDLLYCLWRDISEQRQIIKRLKKQHEQLVKTEEIAQLGTWELDTDSQKMSWSDQMYRIFGWEPQKFVPSYGAFLANAHPDDRDLIDTCYRESIKSNKNGYEIEHRIIHHTSGSIRYVLEKAEHIKNAEGKITRSAGIIQDITARKRLLLESERLTHSISASSNEIYMFDARTLQFIFTNTSAQKQLGYSKDEFKSMTALAIKPEFDEASFRALLAPLRTGDKKAQHYQTRHRTKSGRLYPVEVHVQFFEPKDGPSYFLVIAVNISEQRQLEAKLSSIFSAVNAIIWSTDEHLIIEHVSHSVMQLLGHQSNNFIGQDLRNLFDTEMFHPDDRKSQREAVENMLQNGIPVSNLAHRVKTANGEWKWMAVSISPIYDENQNLQNVVGVVTDISAQKNAEAQLLRLNKELDQRVQDALAENRQKDILIQQQSRMVAMGEMIGNIAHQWRQPLNSLAIILMDMEDSFRMGEASVDSVTHSIGRCNDLLAKMSTTIDDFRNFFKTDKQLEKILLANIVEETTSLLGSSLDFHHIELQILKHLSTIEAWIYPGELSQALLCLINNAKDQIILRQIDQGKIIIELDDTPEWAIIRVSDNAGGISEQHLPKIFDPYFTTKVDGTGLGLYISKLTIEQSMRGQVSVKNLAGGACFTVLLPKKKAKI